MSRSLALISRVCGPLAVFAVLGAGPGCASWHVMKKKPKAEAATPAPVQQTLFVGTIALVDEVGKFALIDNGIASAPSGGMLLKAYTGGVKSGELVASNVRRHPFTIADIHEGAPKKGDRVFYEKPKAQGGTPGPVSTPIPAGKPHGLPPNALPPHAQEPLGLPPE